MAKKTQLAMYTIYLWSPVYISLGLEFNLTIKGKTLIIETDYSEVFLNKSPGNAQYKYLILSSVGKRHFLNRYNLID